MLGFGWLRIHFFRDVEWPFGAAGAEDKTLLDSVLGNTAPGADSLGADVESGPKEAAAEPTAKSRLEHRAG